MQFRSSLRGSALIVHWSCASRHVGGRWCSQPRIKQMFAGNLQLSSDIVLSGNSYAKIVLLFRFFKCGFVNKTSFDQVQRLYVLPAVQSFWDAMQTNILTQLKKDGPAVLAGDGRCDSPGFSAQYCTYSMCDITTKAIVHVEIVDVREADFKSPRMKRIAFQRALETLLKLVTVKEIVTDQHPSITKLMSKSAISKHSI